MLPRPGVPDLWAEDWETIADREREREGASATTAASVAVAGRDHPAQQQKLSGRAAKAQRRAAQAEFNRQLWAAAEAEQDAYQPFFETRTAGGAPVKSDYKPQLKLLSRRPVTATSTSASSRSSSRQGQGAVHALAAGIQRVTLAAPETPIGGPVDVGDDDLRDDNDDGDDDEDGEDGGDGKQPPLTPEERRRIAQAERAEKQRKYDEIRQQLFGETSSAAGEEGRRRGGTCSGSGSGSGNGAGTRGSRSGASTPGSAGARTPQRNGPGDGNGQHGSGRRNRNGHRRGGGGDRAGSVGRRQNQTHVHNQGQDCQQQQQQPSDGTYTPCQAGGSTSVGPNTRGRGGRLRMQTRDITRESPASSLRPTILTPPMAMSPATAPAPAAPDFTVPIREPRGPDGSGRGGFGFAARGGLYSQGQ